MKLFSKTLITVLAVAGTTAANAAWFDNTNNTNNPGYATQSYVGLKAGKFHLDPKDDTEKTNPTAYGIYGGYQFDPNWGAEAEYLGSNKADVKEKGVKLGDMKAQNLGLYGVYHYNFSNTNLYAKAKLGVAHDKVKYSDSGYKADASKTGIAGGLGLGYNITPMVAAELEYDKLPTASGVNSKLATLGVHMKF